MLRIFFCITTLLLPIALHAQVPLPTAMPLVTPSAAPLTSATPDARIMPIPRDPYAAIAPTLSPAAVPLVATTPLLPAPASEPLMVSSGRHRTLFNLVAREFYPFTWSSDTINPHKVDPGELTITHAQRPLFDLLDPNASTSPLLASAIDVVANALESRRQAALATVLTAQTPITFTTHRSTLSRAANAALPLLIEAGAHIQALFQLQMHPHAPALIQSVYRRGELSALAMLTRNGAPFCGTLSKDPACDLLPDFPGAQPAALLWPADMSEAARVALTNHTDAATDPRLSPFTAVTLLAPGPSAPVGATPPEAPTAAPWLAYAQVPAFGPHLERIAALLEQAAQIPELDPTFVAQLTAQAAAFRAPTAYPYHESDAAWSQTRGELELTIGPYETYRDPYHTKAFFEFVLGRERAESQTAVRDIAPRLPAWEQMVGALTAGKYAARTIEPAVAFRVIDVILATGDANADGGPPTAYHLPNVGPLVTQGKGKRVILANHLEAKFPLLAQTASRVLAPALQSAVQLTAAVRNVILHEIFHGIGPRMDLVLIRNGVSTGQTSAQALGEFAAPLEEAKADVGAQWALRDLVAQHAITPDEAKASYVSKMVGLFRTMRLGVHEAHARGAVLQLAHLMRKGVVTIDSERMQIDLTNVHMAYQELLRDIVVCQATGDAAHAKTLLDGSAATLPASVELLLAKLRASNVADSISATYVIED